MKKRTGRTSKSEGIRYCRIVLCNANSNNILFVIFGDQELYKTETENQEGKFTNKRKFNWNFVIA